MLDTRRKDVTYDIKHAGGVTTVSTVGNLGVTPISHHPDEGQGDQWLSLGTFTFNGDGTEYVEINADITSGACCRYGADAARFVRSAASTVSIKNTHYYTFDDADSDGELDAGENIYLVNFVQESGVWVRKYYRFVDSDADNRVEGNELIEVTGSEPDSIKPAIYEEDGTFVRYKDHTEDLQNFANWYSFYRRRELAAKAAVATSITRISRVNVGFYTIHETGGARTGVRPVKVDTNAVIVDNKDGTFTRSSGWSESGNPNEWNNSSYYTSTTNAWAKWTPNLPAAGNYQVYTWYNCYNNRDTTARHTIHHAGGDSIVTVNQRQEAGNPCGEWVSAGNLFF